mgnify:CR=1 FL=1
MLPAHLIPPDQVEASRASSAADAAAAKSSPTAMTQQPASQQQLTCGEEPTLADAAKGSSDHVSCDEEAGQQATSSLKPLQVGGGQGRQSSETACLSLRCMLPSACALLPTLLPAPPVFLLQPEGSLKRPLQAAPSFSFRAPAPDALPTAAAAALKKRRVQHGCDLRRMRELEAQVQLVRQQGYGLKAQLHQAETQVGTTAVWLGSPAD